MDDICHAQSLNSLTTAMKEDSAREEANSSTSKNATVLPIPKIFISERDIWGYVIRNIKKYMTYSNNILQRKINQLIFFEGGYKKNIKM